MTDPTTTAAAASASAADHNAMSAPEFQGGPFVVDIRPFHADTRQSAKRQRTGAATAAAALPAVDDTAAHGDGVDSGGTTRVGRKRKATDGAPATATVAAPAQANALAAVATGVATAAAPTIAVVRAPPAATAPLSRAVSFETAWRLIERAEPNGATGTSTCIEPDALWCRLSDCARVTCTPAHTGGVGKWFVSDAEMVTGAGQPATPGGQLLLVRFRVADPVAALRHALGGALSSSVLQHGVLSYIPELVTQWLPRAVTSAIDERPAAFDADATYRVPLRRVTRDTTTFSSELDPQWLPRALTSSRRDPLMLFAFDADSGSQYRYDGVHDSDPAASEADDADRTPRSTTLTSGYSSGLYGHTNNHWHVCTPVLESLVPGLLEPAPDGRPYTLRDAITAFVCAEFNRLATVWRVDARTGAVDDDDGPVTCDVAAAQDPSRTAFEHALSTSCDGRDAMVVKGVTINSALLLLGRVSALRLRDGTDVCLQLPAWDPAAQTPPQLRVNETVIVVLQPRADGSGSAVSFARRVGWCVTHRCVVWLP